MTASAIIFVFSGLSAASSGAKGSVGGLLSMLSAMRLVTKLFVLHYEYHKSISGSFLVLD